MIQGETKVKDGDEAKIPAIPSPPPQGNGHNVSTVNNGGMRAAIGSARGIVNEVHDDEDEGGGYVMMIEEEGEVGTEDGDKQDSSSHTPPNATTASASSRLFLTKQRFQTWSQKAADALLLSDNVPYHPPPPAPAVSSSSSTPSAAVDSTSTTTTTTTTPVPSTAAATATTTSTTAPTVAAAAVASSLFSTAATTTGNSSTVLPRRWTTPSMDTIRTATTSLLEKVPTASSVSVGTTAATSSQFFFRSKVVAVSSTTTNDETTLPTAVVEEQALKPKSRQVADEAVSSNTDAADRTQEESTNEEGEKESGSGSSSSSNITADGSKIDNNGDATTTSPMNDEEEKKVDDSTDNHDKKKDDHAVNNSQGQLTDDTTNSTSTSDESGTKTTTKHFAARLLSSATAAATAAAAASTSTTSAPSTAAWANSVAESAQVFRGRYAAAVSAASTTLQSASTTTSLSTHLPSNLLRTLQRPTATSTSGATASTETTGSETTADVVVTGATSSSTSTTVPQMDQATRIRLSSAATTGKDHYEQLTTGLAPYEYIVLLGRGKLGVTLKQCYKRSAGVYVDALVPDGAAAKSGLVSIGDVLIRIGSTVDCQTPQSTIATVPTWIAQASRPTHLTFATSGTHFNNQDDRISAASANTASFSDTELFSINHIDVAVAALHVCCNNMMNNDDLPPAITADVQPPTSSGSPRTTTPDDNSPDHMTLVQPTSFDTETDTPQNDKDQGSHQPCPVPELWHSPLLLDELINPTVPPMDVCRAYCQVAAQRNMNPGVLTLDFCAAAALTHDYVRHAIRNAMLLCVADGRRLAFWQRHMQRRIETPSSSSSPSISSQGNNATAMLSLFMGMYHYTELHGIMSMGRQYETARTIAYKFLLPATLTRNTSTSPTSGITFLPPPFDFHNVVSSASLRKLETTLLLTKKSSSQNSTDKSIDLPRDVFVDVQQAVLDRLTGEAFQSFLISADCARMRAYLRRTAPYVNVPLTAVWDGLTKDPGLSATVPPTDMPTSTTTTTFVVHAKNYMLYCLVYLLCMTDQEDFGENDDLLANMDGGAGPGTRIENAANSICTSLFIRRRLLPVIAQATDALKDMSGTEANEEVSKRSLASELSKRYELLWECFVAFGEGTLIEEARSTESARRLRVLRSALEDIQSKVREISDMSPMTLLKLLIEPSLVEKVTALADELLLDYAIQLQPKFRMHKYHEWLCSEVASAVTTSAEAVGGSDGNDHTAQTVATIPRDEVPTLPIGCVKRLLRKVTFPVGVTPHQPTHDKISPSRTTSAGNSATEPGVSKPSDSREKTSLWHCNAECAIVFGSASGSDSPATLDNPRAGNIARYACQSVALLDSAEEPTNTITPTEIPTTLECYALVPLSTHPKPFTTTASRDTWQSEDGWDVSLVNFMVPHVGGDDDANGEDSSIFGVSLMLQRYSHTMDFTYHNQYKLGSVMGEELEISNGGKSNSNEETNNSHEQSIAKRMLKATSKLPCFVDRLQQHSWSHQVSSDANGSDNKPKVVTIGIALVSKRNVVLAMRETLVFLLREFTKGDGVENISTCRALVDILGNFAHPDVEPESLKTVLEPFLRHCSLPWLERPIGSQREVFVELAGNQLIRFLPSIPLALVFITALLEQKIVITSSRRSVLFSVVVALSELLRPLQWCHLLVARVPAGLASDLIEYPAPFILGVASEDEGVVELIRDLPDDVTLVDLDVGRVILAPSFARGSEIGRGTDSSKREIAQALRSQVLYLAQSLGSVIGTHLDPQTWCCDNPMTAFDQRSSDSFGRVRAVCSDFVHELLAGVNSCCYWVEEAQATNNVATESLPDSATVLFDEDRYFYIKQSRHQHGFTPLLNACRSTSAYALSLGDFDLVLELFLRCQSMNVYIGSRRSDEMAFVL